MVDVFLAPDVYVNASLTSGTFPDRVVQRVLGQHRGESMATEWVLDRVQSMLSALPNFRKDAVRGQIELIRSLVKVIPGSSDFAPEAWGRALVAGAKAAKASRVVTDHPDLLALETSDGVDFLSTEAWLLEVTTPPPIPGS